MPQPKQIPTISDTDIETIGDLDIEGPQISPVPSPEQLRHASNVGAEVQAGIPGELLKRTASAIATVPRVLGSVGGAVPLVGTPLAMLGETVAEGIEMAGGAREGSPFDPSAYDKSEIATQGALGAIPGGFVARTFKPTTKAMTRLAGATEGAAMGTLATGASAAAQGRMPTVEELGTGVALGGALGGTFGGQGGARQALPRADYTEKAHNQLYAAIKPEASSTREFSEHLNAALPYIYANRKGYVNTIGDMEQAARGTMRRLWDLHVEPVVAMNNYKPVDTTSTAQAIRARITDDTPKNVRKAIETAAARYDQPRTLGNLNRRIKELNAETRGLQEATGKSARTLRTDPKTAWKFEELNNLRSTLAEQAGEITGNPEMYMKLRKDWGSLSEVAEEAGSAAKRWEHQQKTEAAGIPIVQRAVKTTKGALGFGGVAAARRGVTEIAEEYMTNPDRQVKGAFRRLRFGQRISEQFPEANIGPARRALPAMGETGEPSLGDLQYRLPEDRAAGKHARQRREGSRLLTGQTREEFANAPAPGEPPPLAAGEMELSPGQTPRMLGQAPGNPLAARPSPITIAPPPDLRVGQFSSVPPTQGQTVPISAESLSVPQVLLQTGERGTVEIMRGDYAGVRLTDGTIKWAPRRTLQTLTPNAPQIQSPPNPWMIPNERRRSYISPEEAAQEQIARRSGRFVERRKTMGEGGTPTHADYMRFRGAPEKQAQFDETFERTAPSAQVKSESFGDRLNREAYEASQRANAEFKAKLAGGKSSTPVESLGSLVKRHGHDKVSNMLYEFDPFAKLSPNGKFITTVADPRNMTGKVRVPIREFMSWVAEHEGKP